MNGLGTSPGTITVIAETALALYPILLKNIPANLTTQLTARTATYAILAYILASASDVTRAFTGGLTQTILYGVLNLVHIGVSYASYKLLPAGNAISLFYTYPFWNMLLGWLFLGDSVSLRSILLLIVAFIGTYLVAKNSAIETFEDASKEKEEDNNTTSSLGVLLGLGSAFTESLIFLLVKSPESPSPFLSMLQLYPLAAAVIFGYGLWTNSYSDSTRDVHDNHIYSSNSTDAQKESTAGNTWIPLILFNACIGFVGYALRFYAIPKLSTAVFSILSVIGVVAAYVFQLMFTPEKINGLAALGSMLIAGAAGLAESA
jgi:drug/metabolite transporter (DMT)-like permease